MANLVPTEIALGTITIICPFPDLTAILVERKRTPIMGLPIADLAGGSLHAVVGLLAAVNQRSITGEGQHVDVSMTDAIFGMNTMFGSQYLAGNEEPKPGTGNLNGGTFYDYYHCRWTQSFHRQFKPHFFQRMCVALGLEHKMISVANKIPTAKNNLEP